MKSTGLPKFILFLFLSTATAAASGVVKYSFIGNSYILKKWSNQTTLSHWNPSNPKLDWSATHISNTLSYSFDDTYSLNAYFGFKNRWIEPKERESGTKAVISKDSSLYLTRYDTVTTHASLLIPTSDYSQKAGRRFGVSLEPVFKLTSRPIKLTVTPELTFYNNKYYTFNNDYDGEPNETYRIAIKNSLSYRQSKRWSYSATLSTSHSWSEEQSFDRYQHITLGPDYTYDKNLYFGLYVYAEDKVPNQRPLFHEDSTAVGLSMTMSL